MLLGRYIRIYRPRIAIFKKSVGAYLHKMTEIGGVRIAEVSKVQRIGIFSITIVKLVLMLKLFRDAFPHYRAWVKIKS